MTVTGAIAGQCVGLVLCHASIDGIESNRTSSSARGGSPVPMTVQRISDRRVAVWPAGERRC